jgi:hypothetical protein
MNSAKEIDRVWAKGYYLSNLLQKTIGRGSIAFCPSPISSALFRKFTTPDGKPDART